MADEFEPVEITAALAVPLDPALVKINPQTRARYLDGRHYIETANRIFGYGCWQFRILSAPTKSADGHRKGGTYYALWTVMGELTAAGATFVDLGGCEQNGEGPEAVDMAMKGSVTDALKRCLRNFGDQFGLVLYDKELTRAQMEAEFAAYQDGRTGADHTGTPPSATHEPAAHVDPETGEISAPVGGPKPEGAPAPDARVQAVWNVMTRQVPEWAKGDAALAKEAAAIALNARPAEINKDVLPEYIAAWLDQQGNSPGVFASRYKAHFDAEQKRRVAMEGAG